MINDSINSMNTHHPSVTMQILYQEKGKQNFHQVSDVIYHSANDLTLLPFLFYKMYVRHEKECFQLFLNLLLIYFS